MQVPSEFHKNVLTLIFQKITLYKTMFYTLCFVDSQKSPIGIIVRETENVRLRCGANGVPKPRVTWRRLDNRTINMGSWEGK